jgi:hypothetical protein
LCPAAGAIEKLPFRDQADPLAIGHVQSQGEAGETRPHDQDVEFH